MKCLDVFSQTFLARHSQPSFRLDSEGGSWSGVLKLLRYKISICAWPAGRELIAGIELTAKNGCAVDVTVCCTVWRLRAPVVKSASGS